MNLRHMHKRYCTLAFAALSAIGGLGAVASVSAAGVKDASTQSQYQLDVQRCNTGQTSQSREVCLQEAGAARDEAERKRLDDGQSANYRNNSVDRCAKLPTAQREDCLLQMQSPSSVKGSVEGGGVLRETVIPVTPQPTPTAPGAMTPGYAAPPAMPAPGTATPVPVR